MAVSEGRLTSPQAIWQGIAGRDGLRELYVPDDEFREDFARLDLPKKGRKARLPRFLLFAIDQKMSGPGGDFETSNESLEHVLPENPGAGWESFSDEDRRRFTARLGNYVLLGREQNRLLGNQPFAAKVASYRQSAYPSTKLADVADWTPQAVIERQSRLAEYAVQIWRVDV